MIERFGFPSALKCGRRMETISPGLRWCQACRKGPPRGDSHTMFPPPGLFASPAACLPACGAAAPGSSRPVTRVAYAAGEQGRSCLSSVGLSIMLSWYLVLHAAGNLGMFCPYCCASYSESLYPATKIFCATVNSQVSSVCLRCPSCMD